MPQAQEDLRKQDFSKATREFERLAEYYPDDAQVWQGLGESRLGFESLHPMNKWAGNRYKAAWDLIKARTLDKKMENADAYERLEALVQGGQYLHTWTWLEAGQGTGGIYVDGLALGFANTRAGLSLAVSVSSAGRLPVRNRRTRVTTTHPILGPSTSTIERSDDETTCSLTGIGLMLRWRLLETSALKGPLFLPPWRPSPLGGATLSFYLRTILDGQPSIGDNYGPDAKVWFYEAGLAYEWTYVTVRLAAYNTGINPGTLRSSGTDGQFLWPDTWSETKDIQGSSTSALNLSLGVRI